MKSDKQRRSLLNNRTRYKDGFLFAEFIALQAIQKLFSRKIHYGLGANQKMIQ